MGTRRSERAYWTTYTVALLRYTKLQLCVCNLCIPALFFNFLTVNVAYVDFTDYERITCYEYVYSPIVTAKSEVNKCIGDDTIVAARQSLNCIKNKKYNMTKNDL